MNEPAIFFTPEGVKDVKEAMKAFIDKEETVQDVWAIGAQVTGLANNAEDYASMYHNVDGKMVRHDQVHNLFGYNMTRAAGKDSVRFRRISVACCSRVHPTLECIATVESGPAIINPGGHIFC